MDSVDWKLLRPVQTKSEAGFVVPPSSLPWGLWQCVIVFLHMSIFFPKALRRVLPENPLNTDTSTLTLRHT